MTRIGNRDMLCLQRKNATQSGAMGLAIASSVAILIYVMLLGWLQYRRFEREAAAWDSDLKDIPGMLGAAVATGIAICAGLYVRYLLLQFLPGTQVLAIFIRTTVLCAVGIVIFLAVARLLGVTELARACSARAESMGFDGIHGAFWIGDSIGIDSPLGEGNDACGLLC